MAGVIYGLGANRRILHSASRISWHPYYIQTYLMVKTKRTKKKSVTMTTARTLLFHECEGIKFYKEILITEYSILPSIKISENFHAFKQWNNFMVFPC